MSDHLDAGGAARARRMQGVMPDFDGDRLSLARRQMRLTRTELARRIGVSAAAITQFERNASRPTLPVVAELALVLGVPRDFLRRGAAIPKVPTGSAHFRSLRSTPALSRNQALAFAELGLAVTNMLEQYVELPAPSVPTLPVESTSSEDEIHTIAAETRRRLGLGAGPVPHVVRTLEAAGVVVLTLPADLVDEKVDAFSSDAGPRPIVLLSPAKNDAARSRFDAAHELGHLVLHPDVEPGSRLVEQQAMTFASHFLAPDAELLPELPRRLDWAKLQTAKQRWRMSLRALVYRAHEADLWSDSLYQRANQQLSMNGPAEPGPLGPREQPTMLGRVRSLLESEGYDLEQISNEYGLPTPVVDDIINAATERRLRLM